MKSIDNYNLLFDLKTRSVSINKEFTSLLLSILFTILLILHSNVIIRTYFYTNPTAISLFSISKYTNKRIITFTGTKFQNMSMRFNIRCGLHEQLFDYLSKRTVLFDYCGLKRTLIFYEEAPQKRKIYTVDKINFNLYFRQIHLG